MRSIGMLILLGMLALPAAAQQSRTPAPPAEMKGQAAPQGFSVVLVLGDLAGSSNADANVPPAARKALNDMKDFLPYKGYRLLDGEWILGSRRATTRLRGPDNQDYELTLTVTPAPTTDRNKVHVTFQLRDAAGEGAAGDMTMVTPRPAERAAREQSVRDLEREIAALRDRLGENSAEVRTRMAQLAEAKRRLESDPVVMPMMAFGRRSVMDTSFDMDIGETVVVGTSRLKDTGKDGGRALIALLTAVPKTGAPAAKQE